MDKTTEDLTNEINKITSKEKLSNFLKSNAQEQQPDPRQYILTMLAQKGIRECDFRKATMLDSSRLSHILSGDRNISREVCLDFAFAAQLTPAEADYLLKYCGHRPLYLRDKRDSIIYFGLQQGLTLTRINIYLADYELSTIPAARDEKDK